MNISSPLVHTESTTDRIRTVFAAQRRFFDEGETRSYQFRKAALKRLLSAIRNHKAEIEEAMFLDTRKPALEGYVGDIAVVIEEVKLALGQLKEWMATQTIATPFTLQPASSQIFYEPKGVVMIFAPWNYPFNLAITPLIGAVAAGNCVMLKPAHETWHTASVIDKIISSVFLPEHVSVIQGEGREVGPILFDNCEFNHVFFTGSAATGRWIMEQAARTLTPVTLELGGKSPAIIDASAKLDTTVNRITWAKFFNAGQTCLSTDYALVHASVFDEFVAKMKDRIVHSYGQNPADSPHFARIVSQERTQKIVSYLSQGDILAGGQFDIQDRYISPTLMHITNTDQPVMKEEIFGPILPVIKWQQTSEIISLVRKNRYPLACYIFSEDKKLINTLIEKIEFGGGCINDAIIHYANNAFPFGGVMTSGLGRYHGKHSFDTFSHAKPVIRSVSMFDAHVWYPPYSNVKQKIIETLIK